MRLATWNCCSGGGAKVGYLEALGVDVAVVCEAPLVSPRAEASLVGPALGWVSVGDKPYKGLAIGGFRGEVVPKAFGAGQWSVAVEVGGGPTVLGIWSQPAPPSPQSYRAEVLTALEAHADGILAGEVVVAGDFNVGQPIGRDATDSSAVLARRWEELGLVSVYHAFFGEPVGRASVGTYFHQRHRDRAWHIDYILVPASRLSGVRDVRVGSYEEWVATGRSDHVPVIVDLDW